MTWSTLKILTDQASDKADAAHSRLDMMAACNRKRMFYAPGEAGADSQGCLSGATNTVVNNVVNNPSQPRATASTPTCTASPLVCQAYATNTGRVPDKAGAAFWEGRVDQLKASGLTQGQIAAQINSEMETTKEVKAYQATGKAIQITSNPGTQFCNGSTKCGESAATSKQVSNASTLQDIYKSSLGRAPDAAGAAYWQSQMDKGMTAKQVEAAIKASAEAQKKK
ncbi:DUF4214 domain-containing protein [Allorhizobium sp. NPDC080224]|uniref:DUF4214 domain-containing protein n=1 Tax=Allorhizobium sp. NPDC080224 TaxID=3390547 RepID=UPI003D08DB20